MSTLEPKVNVNTSTDLHLDLLADPTKIKPQKKYTLQALNQQFNQYY